MNVLSSVVDVCKLLLKMELWFLPGFFQSGCYLLMQGKLCKKIGWIVPLCLSLQYDRLEKTCIMVAPGE